MKFGQKVKRVVLGMVGIALLPACQSVVEVPIPEHDPKLAVRYMLGNVVPDSLHYAHFPDYQPYVSHSQSLFSTVPLEGINNAALVVTDAAGNVVETLKQGISNNVGVPGNGYYQPVTYFTATPGQTYTLKVSAPGFKDVSSRLTLPATVSGIQGSFTKMQQFPFAGKGLEVIGQLTVTLPDNGSENNYYLLYGVLLDNRLKANARDVFQQIREDNTTSIASDFKDIHFSEFGYQKAKPFDDKTFNGTTLALSRSVKFLIGNGDTPPKYLRIYVHSITQDTYRFLKSLQNYNATNNNPFAEATRVIGNIENGYGYFGGYTSSYVDITLP